MVNLKIELKCSICGSDLAGACSYAQRRISVMPCRICSLPTHANETVDKVLKELVNVLEHRDAERGVGDGEKAS